MSNINKVGSSAPAFSLLNAQGEKVSLKDLKGKQNVVLYFYPKAMTPGCTVQACGMRDVNRDLKRFDAVALGISTDPPERLARFEEKYGLNFPLLSDPEHQVAEKYGVWDMKKFMGREFMGMIRTTFIIGKDGKIKAVMDKVRTKSHHEEVIELLAALEL